MKTDKKIKAEKIIFRKIINLIITLSEEVKNSEFWCKINVIQKTFKEAIKSVKPAESKKIS